MHDASSSAVDKLTAAALLSRYVGGACLAVGLFAFVSGLYLTVQLLFADTWGVVLGGQALGMLGWSVLKKKLGSGLFPCALFEWCCIATDKMFPEWRLPLFGGAIVATALAALSFAKYADLDARLGEPATPDINARLVRASPSWKRNGEALLTKAVLLFAGLFLLAAGLLIPGGITLTIGVLSLSRFISAQYRKLRRLEALVADELRDGDTRRPLLLLRSFEDDVLPALPATSTARSVSLGALPTTYEEAVVGALASWGPFVALGATRADYLRVGAARLTRSDAGWQEAVVNLMLEAKAIIVIVGASKGLDWELDEIRQRRLLSKTIFLIPPRAATNSSAAEASAVTQARLARVFGILRCKEALDNPRWKNAVCFRVDVTGIAAYQSRLAKSMEAHRQALRLAFQATSATAGEGAYAEPFRERAFAALLNVVYRPRASFGMIGAMLVMLALTIAVAGGILEPAGLLNDADVARYIGKVALLATLTSDAVLAVYVGWCWLLCTQARYGSNGDQLELIVGWLGTTLVVPAVVAGIGAGSALIGGADSFAALRAHFLQGPVDGSKLFELVLYSSLAWGIGRFVWGLRHLLRAPLWSVLSTMAFASAGVAGVGAIVTLKLKADTIAEETAKREQEARRQANALAAAFAQIGRDGSSSATNTPPTEGDSGSTETDSLGFPPLEATLNEQALKTKFCRTFDNPTLPSTVAAMSRWAATFDDKNEQEILLVADPESTKIEQAIHCVPRRPYWLILRSQYQFHRARG
jgi:hypothetical protein